MTDGLHSFGVAFEHKKEQRWPQEGESDSEVVQSCLTLGDPVDCSLPGSSVHGISRQEYWSGLPFPSPGDLPHPGIEPRSPALQADALPSEPPGKPKKEKGEINFSHLNWMYYKMQATNTILSFSWLPTGWKGNLYGGMTAILRQLKAQNLISSDIFPPGIKLTWELMA